MALAGMVVIAWLAWPREPSLLQKAKRIASIGTWRSTRGANCPWVWSPGGKILVVRQDEATYMGGPNGPNGPLQVCQVDTATGAETTQKALNARLKALLTRNPRLKLSGPYPSPDGKWLLWDTPVYSAPTCFLVTSLDGARLLRWPKEAREDYRNGLVWQRDSRAWVRLRVSPNGIGLREAKVYSLDAPNRTGTISLPANRTGGSVLGFAADGRLTLCNWGMQKQDTAYCAAYDLDALQAPPRLYDVSGPPGMTIHAMALSPRGDRLAWMVYHDPAARWQPGWLRSLRAFVGFQRRKAIELWVSRTDGNGMRRIGAIAPVASLVYPGSCDWSPDGKQIAFTYQNTLYTVPAD